MGIKGSYFTMLIGAFCLFLLYPVSSSYAETGYLLVNGNRAVIEGKQLVLIDGGSRRTVAPPGRYDTRDGKYSIIVKGNEIVIRDHTKEVR